jgi:hypothetical protein
MSLAEARAAAKRSYDEQHKSELAQARRSQGAALEEKARRTKQYRSLADPACSIPLLLLPSHDGGSSIRVPLMCVSEPPKLHLQVKEQQLLHNESTEYTNFVLKQTNPSEKF